MGEKRKADRIYIQNPIEVFNKTTGGLLGHLTNYSPGGLMLIGTKQIPIGSVYDCKLVVPDNISADREIVFKAKVAWCEEDILPGNYTIGFQFQNISKEDFRLIVDINERTLVQK